MKILFIEDEQKLARAVQRALELKQHTVALAFDGAEGYELALTGDFDLILLDVMLPSKDGIEICWELRRERVETPILMLTAKGEIQDKVAGLDVGADDYMVKPFSFDELFSRIQALTRRVKHASQTTLRVADLEMDLLSSKVRRSGKEIHLSSKEFALLEFFMQHKNKVVSKESIIQHVWNFESDILPSTIEVHVKHLRDKIEMGFASPLIFTVRGFGYELKDEHSKGK